MPELAHAPGTRSPGARGSEDAARISQEKIHTLADFWPLAGPLLDEPVEDPKARERWLDENGRALLAEARGALEGVEPFDEPAIERALGASSSAEGAKPREVYQPLRVAITGTTISPGIFESLALLGRDDALARIDAALAARRAGAARLADLCAAPVLTPEIRIAMRISKNSKVRLAPLPIGTREADYPGRDGR